MNIIEMKLPAHYACALFYGDDIVEEDREEVENILKIYGCPLSVSESSEIGRYNGLLCDLLEYTFEDKTMSTV